MNYDLYAALAAASAKDADALAGGSEHRYDIQDMAVRIQLLAGEENKGDAVNSYLSLVHASQPSRQDGSQSQAEADCDESKPSRYAQGLIKPAQQDLTDLGLLKPDVPALEALPPFSAFLQFTLTVAKAYISKDDDPLYVSDGVNPVRKDKVFKVPMVSASGWKGRMRWVAMHTRLIQKRDELDAEKFARERLRQALLFGDEKGQEIERSHEFAAFLDAAKPDAVPLYREMLQACFDVRDRDTLPSHRGRLMYYPTYFDRIDVEVINPHSRETKAGTLPIYLECVPPCATGVFSLLYVPFDCIGQDEAEIRAEVAADLPLVAQALQAMLTTYGFGAKTSSGFGVARETVNGTLTVRAEVVSPASQPTLPAAPSRDPSLPRHFAAPGVLKREYLNPDGTFRERTAAEIGRLSKSDKQVYEKAKGWWEREGKALASQPPAPIEPPPPSAPVWASCTFSSFDELRKQLSGEESNDVATALGVTKHA
ncbi:MAG: hypothetical protein KIS91_13725 [Anaerolineae bacterium]|nr:hypothetical protein [Anaerolineae bacterium]